MSRTVRFTSVSFVVFLVCACGDGESRMSQSFRGGGTTSSTHSGGASTAGETSTQIQSDGGAVFGAGSSSIVSQSAGAGIFANGGATTAGRTSTLIQTGGSVSTGGASISMAGGGTSSFGGKTSTGGVSVSIAGGGAFSTGGKMATGGTKTVPCTTPLCQCATSMAGSAGSISSSALMSINSLTDYSTLGYGNYQKSQSGFGVYCSGGTSTSYRTATIGTLVGSSPESEIDVTYSFVKSGLNAAECNCYFAFSDWFSLRRQFSDTQNFCGNAGVSLDLKGDISKPQLEAGLRITIIDTACKNADGSPATLPVGGAYPDELWWYDIAQAQVGANWTSLQIPFNQFRLGNSRTNDRMLDPRCIIAFEVNYQYDVRVWCGNGCSANDVMDGSGHFEVRNLAVY